MVESHKDWVDHKQTDHAHFLLASLQFDQIELDITRTEETITGAETAALRRILRSFCLRNPRVGYCQAMNFVAISLLRAARTGSLSEEDAFWLLAAVCEEIVRCLLVCLLFACCLLVVCLLLMMVIAGHLLLCSLIKKYLFLTFSSHTYRFPTITSKICLV